MLRYRCHRGRLRLDAFRRRFCQHPCFLSFFLSFFLSLFVSCLLSFKHSFLFAFIQTFIHSFIHSSVLSCSFFSLIHSLSFIWSVSLSPAHFLSLFPLSFSALITPEKHCANGWRGDSSDAVHCFQHTMPLHGFPIDFHTLKNETTQEVRASLRDSPRRFHTAPRMHLLISVFHP